MTLIIVDLGEAAILDDGLTGVAYDLHLFTNDVTSGLTPSQIDQLDETDFTEATFTGYASESVAVLDWTVTQANPTEAVNVEKSFVSTANQTAETILGYYVTRNSDGALIWFEEFDSITIEFLDDEIDITPTVTLDDTEGNAVETGTITAFGGDTAPTGWILCDGSAISRSTFDGLFDVIGTNYGVGDGSTTFNLPDLQQRFPLGLAASGTGSTLGDTGGDIDHVHDVSTAFANVTSSDGEVFIERVSVGSWTSTHVGTGSLGTTASHGTGSALQGDTDTTNPPFQVVNYIIKD